MCEACYGEVILMHAKRILTPHTYIHTYIHTLHTSIHTYIHTNRAFEVMCEACYGEVILMHGKRPTDKTYDKKVEANLVQVRKEWQEK